MGFIELILATVLLGFLISLGLYVFQNYEHKTGKTSPYCKPTILITGPNNSGKTALFFKLLEGPFSADYNVSTLSSIEPNIKEIKLPLSNEKIGATYQLIDYPGHKRYISLFKKLITEDVTIKNIKGVIYMIDSSTSVLQDETVREIAQQLLRLFPLTEAKLGGTDFLVAVNKQDLFDSRPVNRIRQLLQAELTKLILAELHESRLHVQDEDDDEGSSSLRDFCTSLMGTSKEFTFDMLEGNVDFIGGSVLRNKTDAWVNWIDERVVN